MSALARPVRDVHACSIPRSSMHHAKATCLWSSLRPPRPCRLRRWPPSSPGRCYTLPHPVYTSAFITDGSTRVNLEPYSAESFPCALYLVATPIGNSEDITFRAIRILKTVQTVYTNEHRTTYDLFRHYGIRTKKIRALHRNTEPRRCKEILESLKWALPIAMVSQGGMPAVSDPGALTIAEAVKAGYRVIPIPGPNAGVMALQGSGLPIEPFYFHGALPTRSQARVSLFGRLRKSITATMVFYAVVEDLVPVLSDMLEALGGQRRCCVARDLTRKDEVFRRGTVSQLLMRFEGKEFKKWSCVTVIVEGSKVEETAEGDLGRISMAERLKYMLANGWSVSEASKDASLRFQKPRKDMYAMALDIRRKMKEGDSNGSSLRDGRASEGFVIEGGNRRHGQRGDFNPEVLSEKDKNTDAVIQNIARARQARRGSLRPGGQTAPEDAGRSDPE